MPATPQRRVTFPLWAKMALVFGGLSSGLILGPGLWDYRVGVAEQALQHQSRLEGVARALAGTIDGAEFATFQTTGDMERPEHTDITETFRITREAHEIRWIGASAMDDRGRYYFVIDGGRPPPLPVGYPIFDGVELRRRVAAGEVVFDPAMEDEWGRWTVAMAPITREDGTVVGMVEVMDDAAWKELSARRKATRAVLLILLAAALSAGLAAMFARHLGGPLKRLTEAAQAVAEGDLNRTVTVDSRDELGALAGVFAAMVDGLREREFIRETFGRFVSKEVAARALTGEGAQLGGEVRQVTILFSDLRGYSALSRRLGPEQMVALLNRYLSSMTDVILDHQGNLSEMLGDGLVVLFGAPNSRHDDALRAVRCAVEMQQSLASFNAEEGLSLEMGIGIGTGDVIAGNIGSNKRMKYGVVGTPINLAGRLESFTVGSQIMIDEVTKGLVGEEIQLGEVLIQRPKGWPEPITCYPVQAAGDLDMPEQTIIFAWRPADLQARCWKIQDKEIDSESRQARVQGVGRRALMLLTTWSIKRGDQYRIALATPGGAVEDLYCVASEVSEEGGFWSTLRILSLPDGAEESLSKL
ncbi:MAG: class 3 adenylate cyclase [Myxococcota bacterium]|jgi:class 3 adenylate cyclase